MRTRCTLSARTSQSRAMRSAPLIPPPVETFYAHDANANHVQHDALDDHHVVALAQSDGMAFLLPPSASHTGARVCLVPLGNTSQDACALYTCALLSAGCSEITAGDVTVDASFTALPRLAGVRMDFLLELPHASTDEVDSEALYPNRGLVRAWVGLCAGGVHDVARGGAAELVQVVRGFMSEVARLHSAHGPQNWPEPVSRVLVFGASEAQMEECARSFGSRVRFITHALDGSDAAVGVHMRFAMGEVAGDLLRALDAETSTFSRLLDDVGSISVTPQEGSPGSANLPPMIMGRRSGMLEAGLFAGIGGFSLAMGSARKRLTGRLQLHRARVLLMAGCAAEALDAADKAARALRGNGDSLFSGLVEEMRAAAIVSKYADDRDISRQDVPLLPDAVLALRDAVSHFDAAAAMPELAFMSEWLSQLCVASRLRFVRYATLSPLSRSVDALCEVSGETDDVLLHWWSRTTSLPPNRMLAPDVLADSSVLAAERQRALGAPIIHRAVAQSFASLTSTSGTPASAIATQESGVISTLLSGGSRGGAALPSSKGNVDVKGLTHAELLDALTVAAARCRDIRSPMFAIRMLVSLADTYDLLGMHSKSDSAAWRACRSLRLLQPVLPPDRFTARSGSDSDDVPAGCVYCATRWDGSTTAAASRAPLVCSTIPAWPYPWLGTIGAPDAPSGFLTPFRFPPALAAACISLGCASRDSSLRALLLNHTNLTNGAAATPRATRSVRAASPRIVLPASAALDWMPLVAADCWQCGEIMVALAAVAVCVACDAGGSAIIPMPASTAVLRDCDPHVNDIEARSVIVSEHSPSAATGASPDRGPVAAPEGPVPTAALKFRNRRYLCSNTASSIATGGPLLVLRAWLNGGVIPHGLSLVDALIVWKLLLSSHASGQAMRAHKHTHARPAPADSAAEVHALDAGRERMSSVGRGFVDMLLADACCSASAAVACIAEPGSLAEPSAAAAADARPDAAALSDAVGLADEEGVHYTGQSPVDTDDTLGLSGGGVDRSPPALDADNSGPSDAPGFVAWRPFVLLHQLAAYIAASGEKLTAQAGATSSNTALRLFHSRTARSGGKPPLRQLRIADRHVVSSVLPLPAPVLERLEWRVRRSERDVVVAAFAIGSPPPQRDAAATAVGAFQGLVDRALAHCDLVLQPVSIDDVPRSLRESFASPSRALTAPSEGPRATVHQQEADGVSLAANLTNPVAVAIEGAVMFQLRVSGATGEQRADVFTAPVHFVALPRASTTVHAAVILPTGRSARVTHVWVLVGSLYFIAAVRELGPAEPRPHVYIASDAELRIGGSNADAEPATPKVEARSPLHAAVPISTAQPRHNIDAARAVVPGFTSAARHRSSALPPAVAVYGTAWI